MLYEIFQQPKVKILSKATGVLLLLAFIQNLFGPTKSITVIGKAESSQRNEVATFSASVLSINDDKSAAVEELSQKSESIIDALKTFGINEDDYQTSNFTVYQREESYYEEGVQRYRPSDWYARSSVEITLRDVSKASELAELLSSLEISDVYGPNFTTFSRSVDEAKLLSEAVKNAKEKAEVIATENGKKVGAILYVHEGLPQSQSILAEGLGGGGGVPFEPGSSNIEKYVTVTFKLR